LPDHYGDEFPDDEPASDPLDQEGLGYSFEQEQRFRRKNDLSEQSPIGAFSFYTVLAICILVSLYLRILGL
jgi:hypothetical protein